MGVGVVDTELRGYSRGLCMQRQVLVAVILPLSLFLTSWNGDILSFLFVYHFVDSLFNVSLAVGTLLIQHCHGGML